MATKADLLAEIERLEDRVFELEQDLRDETDRANDAERDYEREQDYSAGVEERATESEDKLRETVGHASKAIATLEEACPQGFAFTREWWAVQEAKAAIACCDPLHA